MNKNRLYEDMINIDAKIQKHYIQQLKEGKIDIKEYDKKMNRLVKAYKNRLYDIMKKPVGN